MNTYFRKNLFFFLFLLIAYASNISAQTNLNLLGQLPYSQGINDIWGYSDGSGNEYALVGTQTGTSIVDVTNPATPTELHFIPGSSSTWRDLKTWNQYAYVVTEANDQLLIIDLSGLPGTITTYVRDFGIGYLSAHNIFIDENGVGYLFGTNLSNADGAAMIDIAGNPTNPIHLGNYDTHYIHDGFARGDTLWGGHIYAGHFGAIDVSNKAAPVVMATQTTDKVFTHACWPSDDGKTLFSLDEKADAPLESWDVSDLSNIQLLDQYKSYPGDNVIPHNVFVKGNFVVMSYYTSGVVIVDATYPYNLIEVAYHDTSPATGGGFTGCWGVYPYLDSGNILATDRQEGLFVIAEDCQQAAYLEGTITDIYTGMPIPNATVEVGSILTSLQNSSIIGFYATGAASGGSYTVTVTAAGYYPETVTVTITNGIITVQDVELTPICDFPTNQVATNVTDDTAVLSWDAMSNATTYTIYYRELPSGSFISAGTSPVTTFVLSGLNPSTDYQFYVETTCGSFASTPPSTTVPFSTLAQCDPPTSISLNSVSINTAAISWSNGIGATSYDFRHRPVGSATWTITTVTSNSINLTNLIPCTDYEYALDGTCNTGQSTGFTNIMTFTTDDPIATWAAPAATQFNCSGTINLNTAPYFSGTTGGLWSGGSYIAANGTFDPSGLAAGSYPVTYTIGGGNCSITETQNIAVATVPDASWTTTILNNCGGTFDLNTLVTGTPNGTWSSTNTSIGSNGIVNLNTLSNGFFSISYTVGTGAGCTDTKTNSVIVQSCTTLQLKVFLEGAYNAGTSIMTTNLLSNGLLNASQPFNTSPWNYGGLESASTFPTNTVDWLLLELRDASNSNVIVAKKAALLLNDGTVVDVTGNGLLQFSGASTGNAYYVVVRHRNHLAVMSDSPITLPSSTIYDFGASASQVLGANQTKNVSGRYCLFSGDINSDGLITVADFNEYLDNPSQVNIYQDNDINLDSNISTADFNIYQLNKSIIGVQQIRY